MIPSLLLLVVGFLAAFAPNPAQAQDWPQWRGPQRDGVALRVQALAWEKAPQRQWRVEIGLGHAAPVARDGLVWIHSRRDGRELVTCLDAKDGTRRWQQSYDAPYQVNPSAAGHGPGPKSTPALYGDRLYTLGISGILSAWQAADGKLVWRREFVDEFAAAAPLFGTAASPLADGESVYVHTGFKGQGALRAFDAASGATRWSWAGDGPAYASPVLMQTGGQWQIVTQTQRHCIGIAADTGAELWKIDFTTPYDQNSVTPLVVGDLVLFSGLDQGLMAWRPIRDESGWRVEKVWHTREVSLYMSSPVLSGGLLYGLSHLKRGQFFCLDPTDGSLRWTSPGRQAQNAALVALPAQVLALNTDGELLVLDSASTAFEPKALHPLASTPTWAHPVPLTDGLLIKDETMLTRWRYDQP
jgi:outer membrane protein assembly factor BamB